MKLLIALLLLPILLLLVLIEQLPASSFIRAWLPEQISIQNIEGTLVAGQLRDIQMDSLPWQLQSLNWQLAPFSLLTLTPQSSITAHSWNHVGSSSLRSEVTYNPGDKNLVISDLNARLHLAQLAQPLELPLQGLVQISIQQMTLTPHSCLSLTGDIELTSLHATHQTELKPLTPQLGKLSCEKGLLILDMPLNDPQIGGTLRIEISLQGDYQLDAHITTLHRSLSRRVSQLLEPEPDGSYQLRYQSSLYW
ncbi:MAG: type II secretion system protein N [Marinobacterium sp.]|nr:type II secretion system protein N [Marinobacterium sp.]